MSSLKGKYCSLYIAHPWGATLALRATYHKVRQLFYWPSLKKIVPEYVMACEVCQHCKHEQVAYPGLLQPLDIPGQPWVNISMDFIKGLPNQKGRM